MTIDAARGHIGQCDLWIWNPTVSLDDNLMDAGVVRWEPTRKGGSDE